MEEEIIEDIATTDLKGLARYTTKLWDYVTSQEFWDMVLGVAIKIVVIWLISYLVVVIGKKLLHVSLCFVYVIMSDVKLQL